MNQHVTQEDRRQRVMDIARYLQYFPYTKTGDLARAVGLSRKSLTHTLASLEKSGGVVGVSDGHENYWTVPRRRKRALDAAITLRRARTKTIVALADVCTATVHNQLNWAADEGILFREQAEGSRDIIWSVKA